jgi:hypothetical protein
VANEIEVLPSKSRSEAKRRWRDAKACDPVPMNWHELIDRVRTLADQLETVERAMAHPKKSATQHLKKMPLRSEGLSDMFSSLS